MEWFQQGDLLLKPIRKVPLEGETIPGNVLAEGEATGHAHVAVGVEAQVYRFRTNLILFAPNGAEIRHEEHRPITVPAGTYLVDIVREFDHFAKQVRLVVD